jgi:rhodanese-related sulfurtransferase
MQQYSVMSKVINAQEVKERLGNQPAPVLVEALPEKYFRDRHLPGAINLPHDTTDAEVRRVLPDPEAEVIVYCASGPCRNSGILARRLETLGFARVLDFHEGKEGWEKAGYSFEQA